MEQSKIDRINELAHKAKDGGLTEAEQAERAVLRAEFIADFRASVQQQLDSTFVLDEQGNKVPYAEYARRHKAAQK